MASLMTSTIPEVLKHSKQNGQIDATPYIEEYSTFYQHGCESVEDRERRQSDKGKQMISSFYNLVSDFYEYGWAQSFHFAYLQKDEPFACGLQRYEYVLPLRMKVHPGSHLLDLGCGIGGPLRNIARFARCKVTGVTISEYQVTRGNQIIEENNLQEQCNIVYGDFLKLPFDDCSFDGVYAIESTCHTMFKSTVYSEAYRVLKPGCFFAGYEWCVTHKYDPNNEKHRQVKFNIEEGNGLPDTATTEEVLEGLKDAGFELVDAYDLAEFLDIPWYSPLSATFSLQGFRHTRLGHYVTHLSVQFLEKLGVIPKGSAQVSKLLMNAARDLVEGGKLGIYTPMYFFVARKPASY
ncbi:sterol 24-C-methyltransferase [Galdieria sulphuraria]|uniref:Methyltransferase n=1 Tax=Galdieria sulphuraria TaxID=130081 RepID=M2WRC4_GALSU|nr:sterol 24-C-methyltransferase [Galdieria sulphuraria]EME26340.1 sterol 24-C-methyltransferase [Galdieria sulphuraria]|eukprot:XP_005702860.1 sterol 24-C-methyltransferase [Galdieria sulphuraria]